ncbi:hypothetical protein KI387_021735, partial [Taxus chinensis]
KSVKYAVRMVRPELERLAQKLLGHMEQKLPTGPKIGQFRGFRPVGEQLALLYLGQPGQK